MTGRPQVVGNGSTTRTHTCTCNLRGLLYLCYSLDAVPNACLAACAIAYMHNALTPPIAGILNIATNQLLFDAIIIGHETDNFAK